MLLLTEDISVSSRTLKTIINDAEKTAAAVNLVYVNDAIPGIRRLKRGKSFIYVSGKKRIKDAEALNRIKRLVIPPAWENVWICNLENGHLQATGFDLKKRKQYKYHSLWNSLRNHTKFYRLHSFGQSLSELREQIDKDLSLPGMPLQKVLATVISLMERTCIRIGNNMYEKLYGSFGLTTLKNKHVKIDGDKMCFIFKGKKGVSHNISLRSKKLANIVKQCKEIPGKELFQFIDENNDRKCIDSGMVNQYLKNLSGEDFTAKDFRTWAGTVHALVAFKNLGNSDTVTGKKRNIVSALDQVAEHLGNTRSVCKKYYVHPVIITLYENNKLQTYFEHWDKHKKNNKYDLECEEKLLMNILENEGLIIKK